MAVLCGLSAIPISVVLISQLSLLKAEQNLSRMEELVKWEEKDEELSKLRNKLNSLKKAVPSSLTD